MTDTGRGLALLMLCALAGCGDDDGEGEGGAGLDGLEARSDGLLDEVEALSFADPATLPTTGAAAHEGLVGLDLDPIPNGTPQGHDMAGKLAMTVGFAGAGDPVTGRADGFADRGGEGFDGALVIGDGRIDGRIDWGADPEAEYIYGAEMAGEDGTSWIVDASLGGDFAGEDHGSLFGDVTGSGCAEAGCTAVEGGFVAER